MAKKEFPIKAGTLLRLKSEFKDYGTRFVRVEGFYTGVPNLAYCIPGRMTECRAIWGFSWGDKLPNYKCPSIAYQTSVENLRKYYDIVDEATCAADALRELAESYIQWLKDFGHMREPQRLQRELTYWEMVRDQQALAA